ncbi:MAG TPA: hypothetical protein VHZ78_11775 [Rhizomicrobium sp.]|nr:hypothetical protein [Rhizomicrobium sp.]
MSRFEIDSFKSHSTRPMPTHDTGEMPATTLVQPGGLQAWALDGFAAVALILFLAATLLLPIALSVPR